MFESITPQLISLATQAGEKILSYYGKDISVESKSNDTPITQADKSAHTLIEAGLRVIKPNIPILSEESDEEVFHQCKNWSEYWLIDPLDGTREFINQTGEFCVCIAYIKNNRPVFGLIYSPIKQTHYYAYNGKTFRLKNAKTTQIFTQKNHQPLRVVVGHYSQDNLELQAHLETLPEKKMFELGSALKFCKIAEGEYDYYPRFGACSEWDSAAGVCILQMAGGCVKDESGKDLRYNQKTDFLSPAFFASSEA
jgi:3'(2'), 5'-bisphosphate nucleotidase